MGAGFEVLGVFGFMSRSSYGTVWHQAAYRPVTTNGVTSEAFPKKVPPEGSGFSGIPEDFPPAKKQWYSAEGMSHRTGKGLEFSCNWKDSFKGPQFPESVNVPMWKSIRSRSSPALQRPHTSDPAPVPENSYMFLMHGRSPSRPETFQHAGMATFDMRRWQVTNTSSQFL